MSDTKSHDQHEDSIIKKEMPGTEPDAEFGGSEARKRLEKKFLRKLDVRCRLSSIYCF
jgi:hypothetical protein